MGKAPAVQSGCALPMGRCASPPDQSAAYAGGGGNYKIPVEIQSLPTIRPDVLHIIIII